MNGNDQIDYSSKKAHNFITSHSTCHKCFRPSTLNLLQAQNEEGNVVLTQPFYSDHIFYEIKNLTVAMTQWIARSAAVAISDAVYCEFDP